MRNKIIILLFVSLILTSLISAEVETLPPAKQNEAKLLTQICSNCTYVSILSINDKYGDVALQSVNMTKEGSYFYYSFTNTSINGEYIVNGVADVDGYETPFAYNFFVTPSGNSFNESLSIPVFIPMILMLMLFFFFIYLSKTVQYDGARMTFLLLGSAFLIFAMAYGFLVVKDTLFNFSDLNTFTFLFYRVFVFFVFGGAIFLSIGMFIYIIKKAFMSKGYYTGESR